jgi:hypothetical protein
MDAERRPPPRSVPAQFTRRRALGLAAQGAVGRLATSTAHASAVTGPHTAPWAAELTAVIPRRWAHPPPVGRDAQRARRLLDRPHPAVAA